MLHDMASRDKELLEIVKEIRCELLTIAGLTPDDGYDTVLMQGSGTFGVESVISTPIPSNGHLLLLSNGSYGDRIRQMAEIYGIKISTLDIKALDIDFLVSSSNKCIESVPGFSFVICKISTLEACYGNARTISIDLYSQWMEMKKNNQFRFTPPIQSVLAFRKAVDELKAEGGTEKRW